MDSSNLTVIGHPLGMPMKIAGNGEVRIDETDLKQVHTTLDTLGGNSGSPVINENGRVEGILVNGPGQAFQRRIVDGQDQFCAEELRCDEAQSYRPQCGSDQSRERGYWSGVMRFRDVIRGFSCENGFLDAGEGDVDCGGGCKQCEGGRSCTSDGQCDSLRCVHGICAPTTCEDGIQNGAELDVDCGTPECGRRLENFDSTRSWYLQNGRSTGQGSGWGHFMDQAHFWFNYEKRHGQTYAGRTFGNASMMQTDRWQFNGLGPKDLKFHWNFERENTGDGQSNVRLRVTVSAHPDCDFIDDADKVIRFDLRPEPSVNHASGTARIDVSKLRYCAFNVNMWGVHSYSNHSDDNLQVSARLSIDNLTLAPRI